MDRKPPSDKATDRKANADRAKGGDRKAESKALSKLRTSVAYKAAGQEKQRMEETQYVQESRDNTDISPTALEIQNLEKDDEAKAAVARGTDAQLEAVSIRAAHAATTVMRRDLKRTLEHKEEMEE
ncbi:hypothetical protein FGG08_002674 [Glutinoglossum americanum]|uniref:Uncharacterized protein n=1 Tax=Glutinoglossum americanum TaxID=1670608 RepID=A0A9P8I5V6_9PEZI|nr:hypothetical protein FGG08_002674 [Glutinoglossum americanum]